MVLLYSNIFKPKQAKKSMVNLSIIIHPIEAISAEISRDFANLVWPHREEVNLEDIMLYGSVAKKAPNPKDIDLMLIHHNPLLDLFVETALRKDIQDYEKLIKLKKLFKGKLDLGFLDGTNVERIVRGNKLNLNYINKEYFSNPEYRKKWNSINRDPNFIRDIIEYGLLWNPDSREYDLSASKKYSLTQQ